MLALRTLLVIPGVEAGTMAEAQRSAADAVVLDLAVPALTTERTEARATVTKVMAALGSHQRPVIVRVSSASTDELEADIAAAVQPALSAIVLAGTETPQDARDADVLLRKYELRHEMTPGHVRLIPEIDSAAGLQALPIILGSVDRHEAVALNPLRMHRDLDLARGLREAHDHTMAFVAIAVRAAELPWLLGAFDGDRGFIEATRAHEFGAIGAAVASEASVRGVNSLFTPDAAEVAAAEAILREWDRLQADGEVVGVVLVGDEANPRTELVDRRSMRAARLAVGRADAVRAIEHLR
jgi:citrate lyase subunit beta/citryl-CoA lyase